MGIFRRDDGEPAMFSHRNVMFHFDPELMGVEIRGFLLVVYIDADNLVDGI
jgi:hypothetical protein